MTNYERSTRFVASSLRRFVASSLRRFVLHFSLQALAGLEPDSGGSLDGHRLLGGRVPPHAGLALFFQEGSEADDGHRFVVLDAAGDTVDDSINGPGRRRL